MKLTVFGKHPVPQPGFNGVMSLFEAINFSRLGYDVTLALPFADAESLDGLLRRAKLDSLDELNRFGGKFDIVPVFPDGQGFEQCDVLVYQSYFQEDFDLFWGLCKERSGLLTKNYPKFVTSPYDTRLAHVIGQFNQFDLVACALKEDVDALDSDVEFAAEHSGRYAYVPRGASPEMLHPGYKAGLPPTIGLDTPNNTSADGLAHYSEPLARLKNDFPDLRILTLGRSVEGIEAEKVPFGRFDQVYERFFNQLHCYLTVNYEFSPQHLQSRVQQEVASWSRKAIYEVQNVEAQMSGAVLVGHRDNLIEELYSPGETGLNFADFGDSDAIYRLLKHALDNRMPLGAAARRFAAINFSWSKCIQHWSDAIQSLARERRRGTV